jgi:hypothetical protein
MKRKPSDQVQLKLRIREELRRKLEKEAKAKGVSLNSEMALRLARSFEREESLTEFLGGPHTAALVKSIVGIIGLFESVVGTPWHSKNVPEGEFEKYLHANLKFVRDHTVTIPVKFEHSVVESSVRTRSDAMKALAQLISEPAPSGERRRGTR